MIHGKHYLLDSGFHAVFMILVALRAWSISLAVLLELVARASIGLRVDSPPGLCSLFCRRNDVNDDRVLDVLLGLHDYSWLE